MPQDESRPSSETHTEDLAIWLDSPVAAIRRRGIEKLIQLDQQRGGREVDPVGGQSMPGTPDTPDNTRSKERDRAPLGDLNALQVLQDHLDREPDRANRKMITQHLSFRRF